MFDRGALPGCNKRGEGQDHWAKQERAEAQRWNGKAKVETDDLRITSILLNEKMLACPFETEYLTVTIFY